MFPSFSIDRIVRRGLTLAIFAGAGLAAGAQTGTQAAVPAADQTPAQPGLFQTATVPSLNGNNTGLLYSSSNTDGYDPVQAAQTQLASLEKTFLLPDANAMQYGQRRRYGAPRYRGSNTNADGSEKYTVYAGAGFASPVGNNFNYATTSWGFQVGGGRNFNRHFGVGLEFGYDRFGMTGATLNQQAYIYDPTGTYGIAGNLDGNNHIWNFSLQPVYQIYSGQGLGAYITGGVGFYHKVANFTLPQEEQYCDPYYGCGYFAVQANIDHYTSNAPGFDGGIGVTYKFSRFSNERLYAEARYVYIANQSRPGVTVATATTYIGNNFFPQNSNTTSYFPIKFGIRF